MAIQFAKAVAAGNDFIILDNRNNEIRHKISDFPNFVKNACSRKFSVGADGALILEDSKTADFAMLVFNPDGSEVNMCGNGVRAAALYAYRKKWCAKTMKIETKVGLLEAEINEESVKVKMTPPQNIKLGEELYIGKEKFQVHSVDTGVPHVVLFVRDIENYPVREIGSKIRFHKAFEPQGANADFVEKVDKSTIKVRTYERGVEDETLACGTGAVASAIISNLVENTDAPTSALTKSGEALRIYFKKESSRFYDVYLEGKADIVFEGSLLRW